MVLKVNVKLIIPVYLFFHPNAEDFDAPYAQGEYWNVSERFDRLYDFMNDNPKRLVTFDAYKNTLLSIREYDDVYQDPEKPPNYPKEIRFTDKFGHYNTKINSSGFSILDHNNNWIQLSNVLKISGSDLLIGGGKTKIDETGNLFVANMTTESVLGLDVTRGTWLNVVETIQHQNNAVETLRDIVGIIGGAATTVASIASYYSNAQLALAFTSGLISDVGLVLCFRLKEDFFDVQHPLEKRNAIPSNGEVKNQIYLKYGPSLEIDSSNRLAINTRDFMTPS